MHSIKLAYHSKHSEDGEVVETSSFMCDCGAEETRPKEPEKLTILIKGREVI